MTLERIIQDVYEGLGEPSDLKYRDLNDNIDTTMDGWHRLVDAVNVACLALVSWKFPDGKVVRFRQLEDITNFRTEVLNGTISAGSTASQVVTTNFAVQADNYYAGWVLAVGNETYRVLQSTTAGAATQLYLLSLPASDPTGLSASLTKREYRFADNSAVAFGNFVSGIGYDPSNGKPLELIEVVDMTDISTLENVTQAEPLISRDIQLGTPTTFYKIANGLRFDVWPDEERIYTIRYARGPRILGYDDTAAEPELPEQFHAAIELYCLWWGYRRMQENNSAYSTKKDLEDMLRRIRTEYDYQGDYTKHQFTYSREGV